MPRVKKTVLRQRNTAFALHATAVKSKANQSLLQKLQSELNLNQSYLNLVLGLLIVLVAGILVFNYFKKNQANLGPAQQTGTEEAQKDVEPGSLPGKYTVKEDDTLFSIAETYYNDGYQYVQIAEANKLADVDNLEVGQVLEIPKLDELDLAIVQSEEGIGGAENQTIWGEKITGDTYTVVEGDWLSLIAGRAYGDIMAFDKIAQANNISNPNIIEPGMVLQIPR